jgi:hypothetical protein
METRLMSLADVIPRRARIQPVFVMEAARCGRISTPTFMPRFAAFSVKPHNMRETVVRISEARVYVLSGHDHRVMVHVITDFISLGCATRRAVHFRRRTGARGIAFSHSADIA